MSAKVKDSDAGYLGDLSRSELREIALEICQGKYGKKNDLIAGAFLMATGELPQNYLKRW